MVVVHAREVGARLNSFAIVLKGEHSMLGCQVTVGVRFIRLPLAALRLDKRAQPLCSF